MTSSHIIDGNNKGAIAHVMMAAKPSAEMKEAMRLVKTGMSGRAAAKQAGVREESLYRHLEYKAWRQKQKQAGAV